MRRLKKPMLKAVAFIEYFSTGASVLLLQLLLLKMKHMGHAMLWASLLLGPIDAHPLHNSFQCHSSFSGTTDEGYTRRDSTCRHVCGVADLEFTEDESSCSFDGNYGDYGCTPPGLISSSICLSLETSWPEYNSTTADDFHDGVRNGQLERLFDDNYNTICGLCTNLPSVQETGNHQHEEEDDSSTSSGTSTSNCLSPDSTVEVLGKGTTRMADLKVGDIVLAPRGKPETVYAFAHHAPNVEVEFLQLHTNGAADPILEVTKDHLVFVKGKAQPVQAGLVSVGDDLFSQSETTLTKVTRITKVQKHGAYAPLTPDGVVVVNGGIQVSSYAIPISDDASSLALLKFLGDRGLSSHRLAHLFMAPLRLVCMGVAPSMCQNSVLLDDETGMPLFVSWLIGLVKLADKYLPLALQVGPLCGMLVLLSPMLVMESFVGPQLAPWFLFAIVTIGRAYASQNAKTSVEPKKKEQ
ncbi:expressed unknown protein [Seminavis robusta]|uniref:Hint domain-containing protein n=1 Tax=Seminavis robusta TaxID=568900 RepID=A0A9N8HQI9_9STRA|nr:expressed unknown protein [Seminavis robusta]|eukprot:Sro1198_g251631.1  (467) ;mRNA; f:26820-28220